MTKIAINLPPLEFRGQEIKEAKSVSRNSVLGSLHGNTIPNNAVVEIISLDDFHLDCDIVNRFGILSKKLVYRIK